ncbi:hypothetical protein [Streptomyces sp. NPDC041003]
MAETGETDETRETGKISETGGRIGPRTGALALVCGDPSGPRRQTR